MPILTNISCHISKFDTFKPYRIFEGYAKNTFCIKMQTTITYVKYGNTTTSPISIKSIIS